MNKIKIYPPLFALLLILTMVALHYTLPQPQLISPPINALGFVLIVGVLMAANDAKRTCHGNQLMAEIS